ncbi:hypothetical protein [Streptococcus sp. CSL10205-OR2]|uniref:hypothetical protein n=1 Tax=Streptococcus sp. CSL10205-OR2 TaxID=2980558 RepID=UPI0021D8C101|nr:hypothetical protein [Streptococcus sp. CSL10205-OR2]MCU9533774.1 hypothetical protein [Streptococcus sp. CSL10205-OR2]
MTKKNNWIMWIFMLVYLLLFLFFIVQVYLWNGVTILYLSIFTFGLPLVYMLLPLLGLRMFKLKSKKSIYLSFIFSLSPLPYLFLTLKALPFQNLGSSGDSFVKVAYEQAVVVIFALTLFIITSIVSLFFCLERFEKKEKNPELFENIEKTSK